MLGSDESAGGVQRRRILRSGAALVPAALSAAAPGTAAAAAGRPGGHGTSGTPRGEGGLILPRPTREQDWTAVAAAFGRSGTVTRGAYYHTRFPRTDLYVLSRGIRIAAGLALGSHASFAPYQDGSSLLMGDMVVPETALQRFLDDLHAAGIMITAVHKHLLEHTPALWWVHACAATRQPADLAAQLRTALERSGAPNAETVASTTSAASGSLDLDTDGIDRALGTKGSVNGEVFSAAFARREKISDSGRLLPAGLGSTTAVTFQPLGGGRAAVCGDFAMVAGEVPEALAALRRGGLDLVSLHNHGLDDHPRLFFTHYWAVGDAVRIARGIGAAVALTDVAPVVIG